MRFEADEQNSQSTTEAFGGVRGPDVGHNVPTSVADQADMANSHGLDTAEINKTGVCPHIFVAGINDVLRITIRQASNNQHERLNDDRLIEIRRFSAALYSRLTDGLVLDSELMLKIGRY